MMCARVLTVPNPAPDLYQGVGSKKRMSQPIWRSESWMRFHNFGFRLAHVRGVKSTTEDGCAAEARKNHARRIDLDLAIKNILTRRKVALYLPPVFLNAILRRAPSFEFSRPSRVQSFRH